MGALNKNEKLLVEAITSMLQQDAKLGLALHDQDPAGQAAGKAERGFEYLHNQIDEMFMLKAAELTHAESVCQAFHKVHNYKYLDDHSFPEVMNREMLSTAVPAAERSQALGFIPKIIDELRGEQRAWAERDSGLSPHLDEIRRVSQPKQNLEHKIEKRSLNARNITKPKRGDGSPARTTRGRPPLPPDGHDAETTPP